MTSRLSKAIALATVAHDGQYDKNGEPYILHPLRVMMKLWGDADSSNTAMIVAVLHDVVEDTDVTLQDIYEDFGATVTEAVDHLSKRDGETHAEYIERVDLNAIARKVKLKDIEDNMDLRRVTDKYGMYKRYAKAYKRLNDGPGWEA